MVDGAALIHPTLKNPQTKTRRGCAPAPRKGSKTKAQRAKHLKSPGDTKTEVDADSTGADPVAVSRSKRLRKVVP